MPHPERMICWTLCAWFCSTSARPAFGVDDFAFFHENVMGASLELRVLADDRKSARGAEDRVLGEIDHLAFIFGEMTRERVQLVASRAQGTDEPLSPSSSTSSLGTWRSRSSVPRRPSCPCRHTARTTTRSRSCRRSSRDSFARIAARTKDGLYKAVGETLDSVTIRIFSAGSTTVDCTQLMGKPRYC